MALGSNSVVAAASRISSWALLSAALLCGSAAQAQMRISPLVIEAQANRGQAQGIINVTNNSNEPFRGRVYAEPFTYGDNGFQSLTSSPSDLTPYLQFSPRELTVPPGVTRRIRLITRFPPSLPEGEYRAVVFTETLQETTDSSGNSVALTARIGTTVYVRQGDLSPNLAVESASWNPEQKKIQLRVQNTGQASARPAVSWTLQQGNTEVETGTLDPTGIVAESDRNFLLNYSAQGQPAPTAGKYQLTGELVWAQGDNQRTQPFSVNLTIPAN
ncbi:P pilus assembly protein, chaperone PapD [Coleofasciculus sp. LEGE 07092]|nr:P pilus assembly protein, chaperone PapD [Coleofasciculus sp. LEGE 07081]MBE9147586.1 P pilus assembly protein, chaperone PapD [Coleofasciculus sp. LEGE 07092]